jgi:hypothetical protein
MKIAIIGGGIFGCEIALRLATLGHEIEIHEASSDILTGASMVNQARVHTGMHYPRDFETAKASFDAHDEFLRRFPYPITKQLNQIYAIASQNSKTSVNQFVSHADKLEIKWEQVEAERFFRPGVVDFAMKVPESTFDFSLLRKHFKNRIFKVGNINLKVNSSAKGIVDLRNKVEVDFVGTVEAFDKVIVATYSNLFSLLAPHIDLIKKDDYFQYQACEVALGKFHNLSNTGLTVMDGDFWSTMPFGGSGLHSLTSVALTPHITSDRYVSSLNSDVAGLRTRRKDFEKDLEHYLRDEYRFEYCSSLFTTKTISTKSFDTAARPTEIFINPNENIIGVFSGKIASAINAAKDIEYLI